MNIEKVIFSFFIVLALTLNFVFFLDEIDNPARHNVYELYAALATGREVLLVHLLNEVREREQRARLEPMRWPVHNGFSLSIRRGVAHVQSKNL